MTRSAIVLIVLLIASSGCRTIGVQQPTDTPADPRIDEVQRLIKDRQYPDALSILERALQENGNTPKAPEIKYLMATIYVAADNPQRDYAQALTEFDEFLRFYPDHERAVEAKNWRQAIKVLLETRKENERLRKNIEGLKELDVRQEKKRQGK